MIADNTTDDKTPGQSGARQDGTAERPGDAQPAIRFTDQQKAIIGAPADEDILVIAGAGSGKTFTMTHRIIKLIVRDHVPAEKILGLTFTRKAAGELLSRVSNAVDEQAVGADAATDAPTGQTHAAADPDKRFMKPTVATYDAFFQSIVRQYGPLVGIDPQTQPLSDAGARQMIADIVGRNLDKVFALVDDSTDDDTSKPSAFVTIVDKVYALSCAIASSMIDRTCLSCDEAVEKIRDWDKRFQTKLEELRDSIPNADSIKVVKKVPKKPNRSKADKAMSAEEWIGKGTSDPKLAGYYLGVVAKLEKTIEQRDVFLDLAEEFFRAKRERGMAEFSDFTIAAYRLVVEHPSIGAEYRKRYTHVFLDEYQDTSTTQALLLAELFHHDARHRSAVTAVGDPYQSIYSWRGASPGAFRFFKETFGIARDPYELTVSQRNPRVILEAANHLTDAFHHAYAVPSSLPLSQREIPVSPLTPKEGAVAGTAANSSYLATMCYQYESESIASVVAFAHSAVAKYGTDGRNAPVAVLFRSKGAMRGYKEALEKSGLTCRVVGLGALLDRPDVSDIMALLSAICDHSDYASVQRLAMTPRIGMSADDARKLARLADVENSRYQYRALREAGLVEPGKSEELSDSEIMAIVAEKRQEYQLPTGVTLVDALMSPNASSLIAESDLSARGKTQAARLTDVFQHVEGVARESVSAAIRAAGAVLALDVDSSVSAAIRRTESDYTQAVGLLVQQAQSYEQELPDGFHATIPGFLSWLNSASTDVEGPDSTVGTAVDVELMTVHQSKGLEWPAVAVVNMTEGRFPTNQGDNLSIVATGDTPGGQPDYAGSEGVEYISLCKCWLEMPEEVPAQVRADSAILPPFPHLGQLEDISTVQQLEHEYSDDLHRLNGATHDAGDTYLSQKEEYGRRRHDDERRLGYVALTRTRGDALVVASKSTKGYLEQMSEADAAQKADRWNAARQAVDAMQVPGDFRASTDLDSDPADLVGSSFRERSTASVAYMVFGDRRDSAAKKDSTDESEQLCNDFEEWKEYVEDLIDGYLTKGLPDEELPDSELADEEPDDEELQDAELRDEELQDRTNPVYCEVNPYDESDSAVPSNLWMELYAYIGRAVSAAQDAASDAEGSDEKAMSAVDSSGFFEVSSHPTVAERFRNAVAILANENDLLAPTGYVSGTDERECAEVCRMLTEWGWWSGIDDFCSVLDGTAFGDGSVYWPQKLNAEARTLIGLSSDAVRAILPSDGTESETARQAQGLPADERRMTWPLLSRAMRVLDVERRDAAMSHDLISRANAVRATQPASVTGIERTLGIRSGKGTGTGTAEDEARAILRPVPQQPFAGASQGTVFHAWAEQFFNTEPDQRWQLVEGIGANPDLTDDEKQWRHRLVASNWARRICAATEKKITTVVAGRAVIGTIDAVFEGGLDPHNPMGDPIASADGNRIVTIVDWKTGRRPNPDEEETRLIQLDVYRLMFSRLRQIPLDHIDATLYYVGVEDEAGRFVVARHKTEGEIEREIEEGLYLSKDTDAAATSVVHGSVQE